MENKIEKNMDLVEKVVNYKKWNFEKWGMTKDDLRSAGYEGLVKANHDFDESYNQPFRFFAFQVIITHIRREIRNYDPTTYKYRKKIITGENPDIIFIGDIDNEIEADKKEITLTEIEKFEISDFIEKILLEATDLTDVQLERVYNHFWENMRKCDIARKYSVKDCVVWRTLNLALQKMRRTKSFRELHFMTT